MMQLDAIKQIPDKIGSVRSGIHIKGLNDSTLKGIDIGKSVGAMEANLKEINSKLIQLNKLMVQLGGDERNQVEDVIRVLHEQRNALEELIRVKKNIEEDEAKNIFVGDKREEILERQAQREEQQQQELMDLKDLVEEQSREIANHVFAKGEDSDVDDMREELEENIVKLEKLQYDYRMQSKKLNPIMRPGADTAIFENLYRQFQGSGKSVHDFIFKSPLNKNVNRKDPSLKDMGCDKFSFIGDYVNENDQNLKNNARGVIEQAFDEYLVSDDHQQYLQRLNDAQGARLSAFVGKKAPVEEENDGSEPEVEPGNPNSASADPNSASATVNQHANGRKHHPINMLGYGKRGSNSLSPPLFNFSNYLGRS